MAGYCYNVTVGQSNDDISLITFSLQKPYSWSGRVLAVHQSDG